MATALKSGPRLWEGERDDEGHRTYTVTWLVSSDTTDGPANVMQTPGLPLPGSFWLVDSDIDLWAHCTLKMKVKQVPGPEGEPGEWWLVEQEFTTKPGKKCTDRQVEDPLLEPMKVSGNWRQDKKEATADRFGRPIFNSAGEQIRGHHVEFEESNPTVKVEQNVLLLGIETFSAMVDCVNADWLWGLPPRCWRMSKPTWERKYRGLCEVYYTRSFEFEGRYNGWDKDLLDEGTKCLRGYWRQPDAAATGTAQAGAALSITLASTASAVDGWYFGRSITLTGGTGSGQTRAITAYVGATKVATVSPAWGTNPDNTSVYSVAAEGSPAYIIDPALDRTKPGNYVRFKDPHGENARVLLDGAGAPAGLRATTDKYVSLAGFNTGHAVTDLTWWQKVKGPLAPLTWDSVTNYVAGNLVWHVFGGDAGIYVCLTDYDAQPPGGAGYREPGAPGSSGTWLFVRQSVSLGNDLLAAAAGLTGAAAGMTGVLPTGERLPDQGVWNAAVEYTLGDLVTDGGRTAPAGMIHVEKYPAADFLLLGLPILLG